MYERILVPTDGSAVAERAMDHAIEIATKYGAQIRVLHVVNTLRYDTSIESAREPVEDRGEERVGRLVAVAEAAGLTAEGDVVEGRPSRRIVEYVRDEDVDLVVMGTRGEGDLANRLLGSVAQYVITNAGVPVHAVPPEGNE